MTTSATTFSLKDNDYRALFVASLKNNTARITERTPLLPTSKNINNKQPLGQHKQSKVTRGSVDLEDVRVDAGQSLTRRRGEYGWSRGGTDVVGSRQHSPDVTTI